MEKTFDELVFAAAAQAIFGAMTLAEQAEAMEPVEGFEFFAPRTIEDGVREAVRTAQRAGQSRKYGELAFRIFGLPE